MEFTVIKTIEADGVSFSYGAEPILDNISFCVNEGDFLALIGANGAGKSTLLKLLLGELSPTGGVIRLLGEDLRGFRDWPKIGYVPQINTAAGFPATAEEIVLANLYSQIGPFRIPSREHHKKALRALSQVGMQEYAKRLIGNLSGGQQQRVTLARVLAGDPALMLLDEPTTGIDARTALELYELLARLNRETGLTIVMVTHDIARASPYVTRTLCIEDNSLVEIKRDQLSDELSHRHKHPATDSSRRTGRETGDQHGHS